MERLPYTRDGYHCRPELCVEFDTLEATAPLDQRMWLRWSKPMTEFVRDEARKQGMSMSRYVRWCVENQLRKEGLY